jgi:hypothetical protein
MKAGMIVYTQTKIKQKGQRVSLYINKGKIRRNKIVNIYVPNVGASNFFKQTTELKSTYKPQYNNTSIHHPHEYTGHQDKKINKETQN